MSNRLNRSLLAQHMMEKFHAGGSEMMDACCCLQCIPDQTTVLVVTMIIVIFSSHDHYSAHLTGD